MYTPTVFVVRVTNLALSPIGIVVTCIRLWRRKHTSHLWWDDAWAAASMVFTIICMPSLELFLQDTPTRSLRTKTILYYLIAQTYLAINWSARISILFTVIRISVGKMRYILKWIAAAFILMWLILTAQLFWTCERKNADWGPGHVMCVLPLRVAINQFTADLLSDVILVVAPLRLVWNMKLSRPEKIRIIAMFSTTIIMTAISLNHACWLIVDGGGTAEALAGLTQDCVSLIVCNLSVIIAFIFHIATEDSKSSYHVEAGSYSLRRKVHSSTLPETVVRIERTELITLDGLDLQHGDTTKVDQPFDGDGKELSKKRDSASDI